MIIAGCCAQKGSLSKDFSAGLFFNLQTIPRCRYCRYPHSHMRYRVGKQLATQLVSEIQIQAICLLSQDS